MTSKVKVNDSDGHEGNISKNKSVEEFSTVTLLVAAHRRLGHKRSHLFSKYILIHNKCGSDQVHTYSNLKTFLISDLFVDT